MREDLRLPPRLDGKVWLHVPRGYVHPLHHHDELEVNFVVRGRGRYLLGDRRYDLHRHSLAWLFSRQDHVLLETTKDFAVWIAVFRTRLIRNVAQGETAKRLLDPNPAGYFCRQVSEERGRGLDALFRQLFDAQDDLPRLNSGLGFLMLESWSAFGSAAELPQGLRLHPSVERAASLVRENAGQVELEALAREVHLSPARLSRLFKAQLGVAFAAYRNRVRLQRFLELYGEGGEPNALSAALSAGFGSYPQFHRVFRQYMGQSPAEYRRKQREVAG